MINKKRIIKHLIAGSSTLALLLMGFVIPPVHAAITGIVTGKVIDNKGEAVDGVQITLVSSEGRNPDRIATSNKQGIYRLTSVNPGNYSIVAECEGYKHRNRINFRVSANSRISFDVFMDPVQETGSEEQCGDAVSEKTDT
jgi:hypothetical protein